MVLVLAALQGVDVDLIDAALVDGAGWWQRLWHIILPQITPAMTLIGTIMLTYAIGTFDLVFVMTKGGPGTSSELIATYAYRVAFRSNEVGLWSHGHPADHGAFARRRGHLRSSPRARPA